MKKILFIGQYTEGTTARFRADVIREEYNPITFQVIDIHIPFFKTNRLIRSFGFRFKKGPLIKRINKYIIESLNDSYDLIWIDKGVFIKKKTTSLLRSKTNKLIHFTPDPAFLYHKSSHFFKSLPFYDLVITTKSFEESNYKGLIDAEKLMTTTQGFDFSIHKPHHTFNEKTLGVVFIGHYEKFRAVILQNILDSDIEVALAGIKWEGFVKKNRSKPNLKYFGKHISGNDYSHLISSYTFSIGFLSKWIPEKHTTRTFEIPACSTALITEKNLETSIFFQDDEVIFYKEGQDIVPLIQHYSRNLNELERITQKGYLRVTKSGYDYKSIITSIITKIKE